MKKIVSVKLFAWHITSEPGDATRYDYYVVREYDSFLFIPSGSTFPFPQRIDFFDFTGEETVEKLCESSKRYPCNPNTLKECIDTIQRLKRRKL